MAQEDIITVSWCDSNAEARELVGRIKASPFFSKFSLVRRLRHMGCGAGCRTYLYQGPGCGFAVTPEAVERVLDPTRAQRLAGAQLAVLLDTPLGNEPVLCVHVATDTEIIHLVHSLAPAVRDKIELKYLAPADTLPTPCVVHPAGTAHPVPLSKDLLSLFPRVGDADQDPAHVQEDLAQVLAHAPDAWAFLIVCPADVDVVTGWTRLPPHFQSKVLLRMVPTVDVEWTGRPSVVSGNPDGGLLHPYCTVSNILALAYPPLARPPL
jgi:hypothetical protein